MKIVCISDTHGLHRGMAHPIPDGDVLVHAGDCLRHGSRNELRDFLEWFAGQSHKFKVLVAGNHDWAFERHPEESREMCERLGVCYLRDTWLEIGGVKFWGSPWQPRFFDWAFNLDRGPQLAKKWAAIPDDTDVLITHGPPYGIMDLAPVPDPATRDPHVGCEDLLLRWAEVRPWLHVFGHIHEGYGTVQLESGRTLVNAAVCDAKYRPVNPPIVVEV